MSLLHRNCGDSPEGDQLEHGLKTWGEWIAFLESLVVARQEVTEIMPKAALPASTESTQAVATNPSRKGDPTLLDGKESVSFKIAQQYLGVGERQRQRLIESGKLDVVGEGQHRRITTESLKRYSPPSENKK